MAKSLSFGTGLVEYDINGAVSVKFNPTDQTFVNKLYRATSTLENLQDEQTDDYAFESYVKHDKDMRKTIDDLLGEGVADALFPGMNCFSLCDGLPAWMNLMLALWDEVTEAYEREYGKTDGRLKAHTSKYDEMMAKYR